MKHSLNYQSKIKRLFKIISVTLIYFFFLNIPHAIAQEKRQEDNSSFSFNVSDEVATRLHNIDLMRNVLNSGEYCGYDIMIISSTTEEEAEYQQQMLEKTFAGTVTKDGRRPIILSVVDSTEGGQVIGAVYTWLQAEKKMREKHADLMKGCHDLVDYIRKNGCKAATFHNGGKGERCSPLTQSLGNSRGAQKLVGTILNAQGEECELDVLLGVILQCSSFAITNDGKHLDTFWTSQIAFGSNSHDKLIRSNFEIDKFLVGFNKDNLIAQNITDFGTAALNKDGRMTAFYGNKRFASRKGNQYVIDTAKIKSELLSKGDRVAYDFGSFTSSLEMWELLVDYWKKKNVFEPMREKGAHTKITRDIDPHFIQPFIRFLHSMHDIADRKEIDAQLPIPSTLLTQTEINKARIDFNNILREMIPEAYEYIWSDVNKETDIKKKEEAAACMNEVIDFYLLYRQKASLSDLDKVFGFIDLGDETQWFRYRRPIDIMNEKFEMLTLLIGKKIETELNGSVHEYEVQESSIQRSYEALLMRGISEKEIVNFSVDGKIIKMTLDEIKVGKTIEDIYVKNSVVQNCDLTRGSSIVNSVVNHATGKVIANNSYIESSTAPLIVAATSVVHQVIDMNPIQADREVVSDVYKSKIIPSYHGRMRAPIGYDPKGMPIYKILKKNENGGVIYGDDLDETIGYFVERIPYDLRGAKEYSDKSARTEDGRFTFEEIREIEPLGIADRIVMKSIEEIAKNAIIGNR